ncbi:uncharacterized protein LOC115628674 [Scaptodrosophila lebanonensis]|uniref:Uncharacterized protein LOC115628674 n=1 Tax=Drosophila lebanonensis TaxID=7225 RepID=A0A6J2U0R8_DROLE|nr:uncharacterized protein LOC115628674 [Scaptodrosophila lebanonensis]
MAFMMPVMKNNYDIYKDTRSRKTSECSDASSGKGTATLATALGTPTPAQQLQQQQRRRKVSECKSESFATSPAHGQVGAHRMQMQRCHSSRAFPRNASRGSHGSMMTMMSPTRSYAAGVGSSSPPSRSPTTSALERHAAAAATAEAAQQQKQSSGAGSNDYTKFHLRLVDKLRKSFRKDSGKRS